MFLESEIVIGKEELFRDDPFVCPVLPTSKSAYLHEQFGDFSQDIFTLSTKIYQHWVHIKGARSVSRPGELDLYSPAPKVPATRLQPT